MRAAAPLVALVLCAGAAAHAAPPEPPVVTPPELDQLYDGYDMRPVYQLWRHWIEGQKGPVTEALIAQLDTIPDEIAVGVPLLSYRASADLGHFATGDLRTYCRPAKPYGFDRATCHYVLRLATVPVHVGFGDDAPTAWMRRNFEAAKLAAHLKAEGLPPDTNWWGAPRERMFSERPSAAEMLRGEGRVARMDSRTCPAMAQAILAMETKRLDAPIDFWMVGPPGELNPPWPHSATWTYELNLQIAGQGATLKGAGPWMYDIVGPVFDAARGCGMPV